MITRKLLWTAVLLATAATAAAGVRELPDAALDTVTAGTGNDDDGHAPGGVLVANGSAMTVDESNEVVLDSGAQGGVRALNVVNASRSLVAQGLNVWDGRFENGDVSVEPFVEQSNTVLQTETTRSAVVRDYSRDANAFETSSLSTTADNLDTIDLVSEVVVDTSHTVLGQNVNAGLGLGAAGRIGIDVGEANIGVAVEAESIVTVSVGVSGTATLPWPLGQMSLSGQLDSSIETRGSFSVEVTTPPIAIDAVGAVCYTKLGVCNATADDNSTYQTSTTRDESSTSDVRGALQVDRARAEYIVIDESSLEVTAGNSLRLLSGAQANLAAVNAVNAVGSMIANGVNVARTTVNGSSSEIPLALAQTNVVVQGM